MGRKTVGELLSRFHHVGVMVRDVDEAVDYLGIGPFEPSNLDHMDRKVFSKPVSDTRFSAQVGKLGGTLKRCVNENGGVAYL